MSGIAFIVSMIPAVIAYFFFVPEFLRIGPKSYIGTSTTGTVVGIIGFISTLIDMQYRMQLKDDKYSGYQLIVAATAFIRTGSSLYGTIWEYKLIWYKVCYPPTHKPFCIIKSKLN